MLERFAEETTKQTFRFDLDILWPEQARETAINITRMAAIANEIMTHNPYIHTVKFFRWGEQVAPPFTHAGFHQVMCQGKVFEF